MDEPALNLDGVVLSPQKEVVRVFYKEMCWTSTRQPTVSTPWSNGGLEAVCRCREDFTSTITALRLGRCPKIWVATRTNAIALDQSCGC
jgi:hypothetical protein